MIIKNCVLIEAFKCYEQETVESVAKKLRETTLRHIFIVDKTDYPIGIISVIDINNRVVAEGKNPKKIQAKDIMSKPIEVYVLEDEVKHVYEKMAQKGRVMGAVVNDKKMVGIITLNQLVSKLGVKK